MGSGGIPGTQLDREADSNPLVAGAIPSAPKVNVQASCTFLRGDPTKRVLQMTVVTRPLTYASVPRLHTPDLYAPRGLRGVRVYRESVTVLRSVP